MSYIGKKPARAALTSSDLAADIVTAAKIADDAISEEHLDASIITGLTALGATPADTDELIISDAGTLKRMDYSHIKAAGADNFVQCDKGNDSNQNSINHATWTKMTFGSPRLNTTDSATSGWDATNNKLVIDSDNAGKYLITASLETHNHSSGNNSNHDRVYIAIYEGGSIKIQTVAAFEPQMSTGGGVRVSGIFNCTNGQYWEIYCYIDMGAGTFAISGGIGNNVSICRLTS